MLTTVHSLQSLLSALKNAYFRGRISKKPQISNLMEFHSVEAPLAGPSGRAV